MVAGSVLIMTSLCHRFCAFLRCATLFSLMKSTRVCIRSLFSSFLTAAKALFVLKVFAYIDFSHIHIVAV